MFPQEFPLGQQLLQLLVDVLLLWQWTRRLGVLLLLDVEVTALLALLFVVVKCWCSCW
jgi:hypothetical protein